MPKGNANSKRVLYPAVEEATKFATDEHWKDYLKRFARGRITRGVVMENDMITFVNKQGEMSRYRLSSDPKEMYKELIAFFTKYAKIKKDKRRQRSRSRSLSPSVKKEIKSPTNKTATSSKKKEKDPWKSIKKKHLKTGLLYVYMDHLIKTHNLEISGQMQLKHVLYTAELKGILQLCVEMKNNLISNIRCLKYDKKEHKFYLDMSVLTQKELKIVNSKSIIQLAPPTNPLKRIYPNKQLDPEKILLEQKARKHKRDTNNIVRSAADLANENINPGDAA